MGKILLPVVLALATVTAPAHATHRTPTYTGCFGASDSDPDVEAGVVSSVFFLELAGEVTQTCAFYLWDAASETTGAFLGSVSQTDPAMGGVLVATFPFSPPGQDFAVCSSAEWGATPAHPGGVVNYGCSLFG